MLRKKVSTDALFGGFLGDGFDPVLTVFAQFGAIILGIGPGTAGTIDPPFLVELKHGPHGLAGLHIAHGVPQGRGNALDAGRIGLGFFDLNPREFGGGVVDGMVVGRGVIVHGKVVWSGKEC